MTVYCFPTRRKMAAEYSLTCAIMQFSDQLPHLVSSLPLFPCSFSSRNHSPWEWGPHPKLFTQNYMLKDLPVYCGYANIYSCRVFFFPPVPTQHYRKHSYICHPTWDLFTLSQERWHMGCCINLSHSWWRQFLSRMAVLESLLLWIPSKTKPKTNKTKKKSCALHWWDWDHLQADQARMRARGHLSPSSHSKMY